VLFALASPGLLALASHGPASLTARRGLVISLVALAMLLGPAWRLSDDVLVPLPFAVLTASVGGFFRFPFRFVVMLGFGIALLSAAAVQALASRRPRLAPLAAVLVTTVVLLTRGRAVVGDRLDEIGGQWLDVYTAVGEAADRGGRGPLLELPVVDSDDPCRSASRRRGGRDTPGSGDPESAR
jgi:hypothetical protein